MRHLGIMLFVATLAGCGAEVAGTAASSAAAKAEEARQAQQLQQRVQEDLDATMDAGQQRLQQTEQ